MSPVKSPWYIPFMPPRSRCIAATVPDVASAAEDPSATAVRAVGGYGAGRNAREYVDAAVRRTMTMGVVVGDIENEFFASIVRGFSGASRAREFGVLISITDENVDEHLDHARRSGVSLRIVDRREPKLAVVTVSVVAAAREAACHLLAAGHRRLGVITGFVVAGAVVSTGIHRPNGYRAALERAGVRYDPADVVFRDFRVESARARARPLLLRKNRPTAHFATDSVLAFGVLLAIRDLGLRCPQDVSVVSFVDPAWVSVVRPRLSVMAQPLHDLGATAARRPVPRVRGEVNRPRPHVLGATRCPGESNAPRARLGGKGRLSPHLGREAEAERA